MTYLMILIFSLNLFANNNSKTISVTGQCEQKVLPDRGSVNLVAQVTDKQSTVASKKTAEIYEKLKIAVQKLNLKDLELQTTESNIQEQFDYSVGKRSSLGFQATMGLQVSTSEFSRLGEVMGLTQQLTIQRAENLRTYLSDEKTKLVREECLVVAVKNAKEKARKMAEALQSKLGEPLTISEGVGSMNPPQPFYEARAMSDAVESSYSKTAPTIEAKSMKISVDVQVQFSLKN